MNDFVNRTVDQLRASCDRLSDYAFKKDQAKAFHHGEEADLEEAVNGLSVQIAGLEMSLIKRDFSIEEQRVLLDAAESSILLVERFLCR